MNLMSRVLSKLSSHAHAKVFHRIVNKWGGKWLNVPFHTNIQKHDFLWVSNNYTVTYYQIVNLMKCLQENFSKTINLLRNHLGVTSDTTSISISRLRKPLFTHNNFNVNGAIRLNHVYRIQALLSYNTRLISPINPNHICINMQRMLRSFSEWIKRRIFNIQLS